MIFEVTYKNAEGEKLQVATFNAPGVREALEQILAVPTLHPPPGTVDIDVRTLPAV
jgi:hypothetical protein